MSIEYPCVHFVDKKCKKFSDEKFTSYCVYSPCEDQEPSNADRIRAMSDEELGKWLCSTLQCEYCKWDQWDGCSLKEWLKQPAEMEK